jgi:hypothetical protein
LAITTLAAVNSGLQPKQYFSKNFAGINPQARFCSYWGVAGGRPAAGAFDATLNGVALTAPVTGQIPFTNPTAGNAYLARLQAALGTSTVSSSRAMLLICDRLWHNGGFTITSTGAQNITSPTWPARDEDGATSGRGVLLGVEVSAAVGAATPTITVAYTNSGGTASRSGTNIDTTVSASGVTNFYTIGLQAGDVGVRSVQSLTLSASWLSGTINLVAFRVLAVLDSINPNISQAIDAITGGLPRLYNGTVPFLLLASAANTTLAGEVQYTWG